jgi:DNA-binding LacI/PurR family transcriptional regulator
VAGSNLTMDELAKLAGVSKITVSRALRGGFAVNKETRDRIFALAKEHGYRLNQAARNLRLDRSHTVGVIVEMSPSFDRPMSDPYPLELLGGISQTLTSRGYSLLLTTMAGKDSIAFQGAEGIILLGQGINDEAVKALQPVLAPLVVWGAPHEGADYCIVGSDNYHGGQIAAERLIDLGRRRLVFLGDTRHAEVEARFRGFSNTAKERGANIVASIPSPFTFTGGLEAAQSLVGQGVAFDGVLGSNDLLTMGFVRALIEANMTVPSQVSVIGYDDTPLAATFSPALSSVHQNWRNGGILLAQKVLQLINGESAASEVMQTSLTLRAT